MATAGTFFVTVSCIFRGYHVYKVWNARIGEALVSFAEEETSHDKKAVISKSDDISKRNTDSEPLSGANTVVKHCSRGAYCCTIAILQYCCTLCNIQGEPPFPKLEVLPNFKVGQ